MRAVEIQAKSADTTFRVDPEGPAGMHGHRFRCGEDVWDRAIAVSARALANVSSFHPHAMARDDRARGPFGGGRRHRDQQANRYTEPEHAGTHLP
jgi:hypothetical protein